MAVANLQAAPASVHPQAAPLQEDQAGHLRAAPAVLLQAAPASVPLRAGPGVGPAPGGKKKPAGEDPVAQAQAKKQMDILLRKARAEYGLYFKEPTKVPEFWSAINFEINTGKFEIAGFFLKKMLELEPIDAVDRQLAIIQQTVGNGPFFHLKNVQKWSDNKNFDLETRENVKTLLKRVTRGVESYLRRRIGSKNSLPISTPPRKRSAITLSSTSTGPMNEPCPTWFKRCSSISISRFAGESMKRS